MVSSHKSSVGERKARQRATKPVLDSYLRPALASHLVAHHVDADEEHGDGHGANQRAEDLEPRRGAGLARNGDLGRRRDLLRRDVLRLMRREQLRYTNSQQNETSLPWYIRS